MDHTTHLLTWLSRAPQRRGRATRRFLVLVAVVVGLAGVPITTLAGASTSTTASTTASTGTVVSSTSSPYGTVLTVGSGQFAGYSLYYFTRDTPAGCTTTTVTVMGMPLSCTGAETDKTADWPALTTVGAPIAENGVSKHLLGSVYRKDLAARQVTYAGHLLYLFDLGPHMFTGTNFMETVSPLPPWRGIWYLVQSKNGRAAVGPIALSAETLPAGTPTLAAAMFQGMGAQPIAVYTYSKDKRGASSCSGTCALTWPPVLTTAPSPTTSGLPPGSVGVITRPDGTRQLTYHGKPLYFYSKEVFRLDAKGNPLNPPSSGSGNGVTGPAHSGGKFSLVPAP